MNRRLPPLVAVLVLMTSALASACVPLPDATSDATGQRGGEFGPLPIEFSPASSSDPSRVSGDACMVRVVLNGKDQAPCTYFKRDGSEATDTLRGMEDDPRDQLAWCEAQVAGINEGIEQSADRAYCDDSFQPTPGLAGSVDHHALLLHGHEESAPMQVSALFADPTFELADLDNAPGHVVMVAVVDLRDLRTTQRGGLCLALHSRRAEAPSMFGSAGSYLGFGGSTSPQSDEAIEQARACDGSPKARFCEGAEAPIEQTWQTQPGLDGGLCAAFVFDPSAAPPAHFLNAKGVVVGDAFDAPIDALFPTGEPESMDNVLSVISGAARQLKASSRGYDLGLVLAVRLDLSTRRATFHAALSKDIRSFSLTQRGILYLFDDALYQIGEQTLDEQALREALTGQTLSAGITASAIDGRAPTLILRQFYVDWLPSDP